MDQQPMTTEQRRTTFVQTYQSGVPIDPLKSYDGPQFLADRRHVTDPVTTQHSQDGLVTVTNPIQLQLNPFYQPHLPIFK
jgi:hypothetical protein